MAITVETTHAAPPISPFISPILADGLMDIPPVSNVTPECVCVRACTLKHAYVNINQIIMAALNLAILSKNCAIKFCRDLNLVLKRMHNVRHECIFILADINLVVSWIYGTCTMQTSVPFPTSTVGRSPLVSLSG